MAPLYVCITVNGGSTQLSLKMRVAIPAWRQKEQTPEGGGQEDRDTRERMRL